MIPIKMPQVGQDYPSGTIVEWLKHENDPVRKGDIILTVESEKATFDVEADADGILMQILYEQGAEVDILKPVAFIGQPGEIVPESGISDAVEAVSQVKDPVSVSSINDQVIAPSSKKRNISPAAKRAAEEQGIDWTQINGTGPGGRITKRDVVAVLEKMPPAQAGPQVLAEALPDQDEVIRFSRMRAKIAERLTHSVQTIPHFYLNIDVDVTALLARRRHINQESDVRISVTDLIIKVVARTLRQFDRLNAHVDSEKMTLKKDVNIGVAVAVEDGLLVPVIPHADQISLREISKISAKNAAAARRGSVNPIPSGTFTVSTLGMYGIRIYLPIINPPESAILAVGAAEKRVVPVEGNIGIRDMMSLTLAADHRAVDGAYAAEFLNQVKHRLEEVQLD